MRNSVTIRHRLLHIELEGDPRSNSTRRQAERYPPADLTIEVRPRQLDCPYHRLDAARHRAACCQQARTRGTGHVWSTLYLLMGVLHDRLGDATRQLLP
jgi:hypothetical protein